VHQHQPTYNTQKIKVRNKVTFRRITEDKRLVGNERERERKKKHTM